MCVDEPRSLGAPERYSVPDGGCFRFGGLPVSVSTTDVVVEIVSPSVATGTCTPLARGVAASDSSEEKVCERPGRAGGRAKDDGKRALNPCLFAELGANYCDVGEGGPHGEPCQALE